MMMPLVWGAMGAARTAEDGVGFGTGGATAESGAPMGVVAKPGEMEWLLAGVRGMTS